MKQDSDYVAREARRIYEERLRTDLEVGHIHKFVAIEPISGEYFLGNTLSEAIGASRTKYPDRMAHVIQVGHRAAIVLPFIQLISHSNSAA